MNNHLHRTYIVSIPRSGQHLVARGLMWCLPDLVVYSENYQVGHRFNNNPAVNIQKEHDFNLDLPMDPNYRYVVLLRGFIPSIISWWRFTVATGAVDDNEDSFRRFIEGKVDYWAKFNDKWAPNATASITTCHLRFRELRNDPAGCMRRVVKFVVRDVPQVLAGENPHPHSYESFGACCMLWMQQKYPEFRYNNVIDEVLAGNWEAREWHD